MIGQVLANCLSTRRMHSSLETFDFYVVAEGHERSRMVGGTGFEPVALAM